MKILLVGLGAIGQRHARNFRAALGEKIQLTAFRQRRTSPTIAESLSTNPGIDPEESYGIRVFDDLDSALADKPDAAVIANPSSLHLAVGRAAAEAGCALLIEKPISHTWDGIPEFLNLVERAKLITLVGYQWRFHPLLRMLEGILQDRPLGRVVAVRATFGEFLPDWHPYEDYRQSYASRRALGGGVLLTQIHDFDYLGWLVGWPEQAFSIGGHLSRLDVDVEDVASTLLRCRVDGQFIPVHVHQDYLQKPGVRSCEIIAERGRIDVDLAGSKLRIWDSTGACVRQEEIREFVRNDMFMAQTRHFLACLEGRETPLVPAHEGARSLAVTLAAQRSQLSGQPESVTYP